MPAYDYACDACQIVREIRHSIKSEEIYKCEKCGEPMHIKICTSFHVATCNLKPTLADIKESNHKSKTSDRDRARRSRVKAFGSAEVGTPVDKADPRHVFKKGRTIAGEERTIDKADFIKAASKSDQIVSKCVDILNKKQK